MVSRWFAFHTVQLDVINLQQKKNKTMHYHTFFFVLHNIIKLNKIGVHSFSELEICTNDCGQLKDAKDKQYSFKKDAK